MAYDDGNVFAKILRGEMGAHRVFEDEHCVAFMDVMPQSPGHTLVVPREPAEDVFALSPASWAQLTATAQRVARAVKQAFAPDGVTLMQLNGAAAGQTVFHIHVHVIPRYAGQALRRHGGGMAPDAELAAHAAKIRAALEG